MSIDGNVENTDRYDGLATRGEPFDTTEIRWFASGPPPDSFVEWFSDGGRAGAIELRRDDYRAGTEHWVGLKRRNLGDLEIKLRRGLGRRLPVGGDFVGSVEEWRKLGLEEPPRSTTWQWSVVNKVVLTRTFGCDSANLVGEVAVDERTPPACDIELATVSIGEMVWWTFALEAWGAPQQRRLLMAGSLAALLDASAPIPPSFVSELAFNMGYPEWLASVAGTDQLISS